MKDRLFGFAMLLVRMSREVRPHPPRAAIPPATAVATARRLRRPREKGRLRRRGDETCAIPAPSGLIRQEEGTNDASRKVQLGAMWGGAGASWMCRMAGAGWEAVRVLCQVCTHMRLCDALRRRRLLHTVSPGTACTHMHCMWGQRSASHCRHSGNSGARHVHETPRLSHMSPPPLPLGHLHRDVVPAPRDMRRMQSFFRRIAPSASAQPVARPTPKKEAASRLSKSPQLTGARCDAENGSTSRPPRTPMDRHDRAVHATQCRQSVQKTARSRTRTSRRRASRPLSDPVHLQGAHLRRRRLN